ncbi:unnamed protein product, partial [Vitis vinifera]
MVPFLFCLSSTSTETINQRRVGDQVWVKKYTLMKFASFIGHLVKHRINSLKFLGLGKLMEDGSICSIVVAEPPLLRYPVKYLKCALRIGLAFDQVDSRLVRDEFGFLPRFYHGGCGFGGWRVRFGRGGIEVLKRRNPGK